MKNLKREHLQIFKYAIAYFGKLYKQGKISNKQMQTLVNLSCAIYLENQLEDTIDSVLKRRLQGN